MFLSFEFNIFYNVTKPKCFSCFHCFSCFSKQKKTVLKYYKGTGTRARLTENKQIQCYNNPVQEAYEAPYLRRLFCLCKKASLGLKSRVDLCCYGVSSDTKNKNNKKIFISPFLALLKKNNADTKKNIFFSCILLVYYNPDTPNIKSWICP